tara:strand:- start:4194 stop:5141 length:948 start_codon:yes stop_codon:yes gene_type:complete
MPYRLGYACINNALRDKKIRANRRAIKRTFQQKGLGYIGELVAQNLRDLHTILEWNNKFDIRVFRMSSDITPWGSEYEFTDLPNSAEVMALFKKCGQYALDNDIRLSFHPGQFCVLASPKEKVVLNAISDLELHGRLMDAFLQPRSHLAKINIHLGGAYGDKRLAAQRFNKNFPRLSDAVKTRLTVENDDRPNLFSTQELYDYVYTETGIPIVFDFHHHAIHPDGLSEQEGLALAFKTWQVRPCTHYSESKQVERPTALLRAHSTLIYKQIQDHGMDFDCVVEAKGKEQAVLLHRRKWGTEMNNSFKSKKIAYNK